MLEMDFRRFAHPRGIGRDNTGHGESGWEAESRLLGAYLYLEWSGGFRRFLMNRVVAYYLEDPANPGFHVQLDGARYSDLFSLPKLTTLAHRGRHLGVGPCRLPRALTEPSVPSPSY